MILHEKSSTSADVPQARIGLTTTTMREMNTDMRMIEAAAVPLPLVEIDSTSIEMTHNPEEGIVPAIAAGAGVAIEAVHLQAKDLLVGACRARKL